MAQWDAMLLAFELGTSCNAKEPVDVWEVPAGREKKHVHFHHDAQVFIGLDEEIAMIPCNVPVESLCHWHDKPWNLYGDLPSQCGAPSAGQNLTSQCCEIPGSAATKFTIADPVHVKSVEPEGFHVVHKSTHFHEVDNSQGVVDSLSLGAVSISVTDSVNAKAKHEESDVRDDSDEDVASFMHFQVPELTPQRLQELVIAAGVEDCVPEGFLTEVPESTSFPGAMSAEHLRPTVYPRALQNLFTHFQNHATHGATHAHAVITWYVNHEQHPRCEHYRRVELGQDPRRWATLMVNRWRDTVVAGYPFNFFVVRPTPHGFETPGLSIPHVIIQQQPRPGMRSVVISGNAVHENPHEFFHWADTLPLMASKAIVVEAARITDFCWPLQDEQRCQVWRGNTFFARSDQILLDSGDSLLVVATPLIYQDTVPRDGGAETDEVWLAQGQQILHVTDRHRHDAQSRGIDVTKLRRLHERGNEQMQQQYESEHEEQSGDDESLEGQDEYLQNLLETFQTHAADVAGQREAWIRTWYVDHFRHRTCFQPRFVRLRANWHNWYDHIVDRLNDRVDLQIGTHLVVVTPEVMQVSPSEDGIADVILIQGHADDRKAILTTVNHIRDPPSLKHAAFSVRERFSGVTMLQDIACTPICLNADCTLYQANSRIPLNDVRRYRAIDGQWFLVQLQDDAHRLMQLSPAEAEGPQMPMTIGQQIQEFAVLGIEVQPEDLYGVFLYGLNKPEQFAYLAWHSHQHLILDAARFLNVRATRIWALHELQCTLTGQPEDTAAVIVQSEGDLNVGSLEQLVLIDIEEHRHPIPQYGSVTPTVTRKVKKLPHQLTRLQLLHRVHVNVYCHRNGDRCIVKVDDVLWPLQDITLHLIRHGMYIRIILPPDPDIPSCSEVEGTSQQSLTSGQVGLSMIQLKGSVQVQRTQDEDRLDESHEAFDFCIVPCQYRLRPEFLCNNLWKVIMR